MSVAWKSESSSARAIASGCASRSYTTASSGGGVNPLAPPIFTVWAPSRAPFSRGSGNGTFSTLGAARARTFTGASSSPARASTFELARQTATTPTPSDAPVTAAGIKNVAPVSP